MTYEELHTALFEKLYDELTAYRQQLMALPPREILDHTFEHTIKQDIVCVMENEDLDEAVVRALLRSPHPLNAIYKEYRNRETQHMDILRDCFETEAEASVKRERDRQKGRKKNRDMER